MSKGLFSGKRTSRGIGITRTVCCAMQAVWNNPINGVDTLTTEVPLPALPPPSSRPTRPLRTRGAMYVKYFANGNTSGKFFLVERQTTISEAVKVGYPLLRNPDPETLKQKRLKQVYLPITGAIRVYSGQFSIEFGSTLEFS